MICEPRRVPRPRRRLSQVWAHDPVNYDQDLLKVVDRIGQDNFVLVSEGSKIRGIVTSADLNTLFRERTAVFLVVGEIDQRLRDALRRHFDEEELLRLCNEGRMTPISSVDKLDMGDYQHVLERPVSWQQMGWDYLDRGTFINRLIKVRELRNFATHFNGPDPPDPKDVALAQNFCLVLRTCG